jgi:hypothetical protein
MNNAKSDPRDFSVVQFSLGIGPAGRPAQQAVLCEASVSVEEAFDSARRRAYEEVARLEAVNSEAGTDPRPVELIDTEWGYDIRCAWLVVTRFWVHDCTVRAPLVIE